MKYDVYFEIYGKKMRCKIDASNENDAEYKLRGKIKVHKITQIVDDVDIMKDMFGFN